MWEVPQGQGLGLDQDLAQLPVEHVADRKDLAPGTWYLAPGTTCLVSWVPSSHGMGKGAVGPRAGVVAFGQRQLML